MRFAFYALWAVTAPFFAGGVFWIASNAFLPNWAILTGMFVHLIIWATVMEYMQENRWDV